MHRILCLLAISLLLAGAAFAEPANQPAGTGLAVGDTTKSFVVLDVTGPHKGEPICYVCEYRNAPTVLAFFQDVGDETASLIVKLNELALSQKKLKAVGVVIAGPDQKDWLEKLAQDKGIKFPLVVFRKGKSDINMKLYKLQPDAKNTLIVAVDRKVSAQMTNVTGDSFAQVAEATSKVLGAAKP
jgi:hypothetical protein